MLEARDYGSVSERCVHKTHFHVRFCAFNTYSLHLTSTIVIPIRRRVCHIVTIECAHPPKLRRSTGNAHARGSDKQGGGRCGAGECELRTRERVSA